MERISNLSKKGQTSEAVAAELGGLPDDHMHCASLELTSQGK
jgi:hypothetical protein